MTPLTPVEVEFIKSRMMRRLIDLWLDAAIITIWNHTNEEDFR